MALVENVIEEHSEDSLALEHRVQGEERNVDHWSRCFWRLRGIILNLDKNYELDHDCVFEEGHPYH
jgi:hypothetical protein